MNEHAGGWARHDAGSEVVTTGPFVSDMTPPRGVLASDMPMAKPRQLAPRVRTVAGATGTSDEDHQPGGGTWSAL